ncbi:MAG TPA: hypothetical protein VLC52_09400, partial [Anaerolineae bacterium]|nr:hypothetical protein [Anaerolineae bacterium]
MEDCLWDELKTAQEQGEDPAPYLERLERCRWDHDVASCDVCRGDGHLSAQECLFKVYNLG